MKLVTGWLTNGGKFFTKEREKEAQNRELFEDINDIYYKRHSFSISSVQLLLLDVILEKYDLTRKVK